MVFAYSKMGQVIALNIETINTFSAKDIYLRLRKEYGLSLTITNPPSFGDFLKIKKQLTKLGK